MPRGRPTPRQAVLSTGTDLRRAALESIDLLSHLTALAEHDATVVRRVITLLDVPQAGDSLPSGGPHTSHRFSERDPTQQKEPDR